MCHQDGPTKSIRKCPKCDKEFELHDKTHLLKEGVSYFIVCEDCWEMEEIKRSLEEYTNSYDKPIVIQPLMPCREEEMHEELHGQQKIEKILLENMGYSHEIYCKFCEERLNYEKER